MSTKLRDEPARTEDKSAAHRHKFALLENESAERSVATVPAGDSGAASARIVEEPSRRQQAEAPIGLDRVEVLPEYLRVKQLVKDGGALIFVTGGAGTGKSTFIRWLTSEFQGHVLLGAPTAIAAL